MPLYPPTVSGPASSVDSEITLYSGTSGKIIKRAANTGILKASSGVIATATAGTDYLSGNQSITLTGDVTGSGTTSIACTIPANSIALADMATMATDSILGRATAATGNVEVLTALPFAYTGDVTRAIDSNTTALANIPLTTTIGGVAGTRGDVLYYGASGWAKLAAGTSGNQLTTNGAGADPTWAAPGSGGSGSPGGSTTQVEYNNAGAFGGITGATTDGTTLSLKNLTMVPTSGTVNSTINFGANYQAAALILYNGGTAANWGWGMQGSEMQFFVDAWNTGVRYAWNKGGDLQVSGTNEIMRLDATAGHLIHPSGAMTGFSSTGVSSGTVDTALARNAAGTVEINNGTAGTYRDLILRNLTVSGTGSVQVTSNNATEIAFRNTAATARTILRVSPNGSVTTIASSVQAFGTDFSADSTNYEGIAMQAKGSADSYHTVKSFIGGTGTLRPLSVNADNTTTQLVFSTTGPITVGGTDVGFARNTSGVLEINSGTAGTYRDIIARTHNATSGYQINGTAVAADYINSSVSSQSPSTSDVYLTGSNVAVPAGAFAAKGQYRCLFDVTKTAGTGGIVISVRTGTAGTTGDTANLTFTFPAGTSVADVGTFKVFVNWRTIGSGTSAVVSGVCRAIKNTVTAAGLWSDTSAAKTIVATVSSGFASNTFTNMGCSFNGGTAFAGTITTVQATLNQ